MVNENALLILLNIMNELEQARLRAAILVLTNQISERSIFYEDNTEPREWFNCEYFWEVLDSEIWDKCTQTLIDAIVRTGK